MEDLLEPLIRGSREQRPGTPRNSRGIAAGEFLPSSMVAVPPRLP